MHLKTFFVEILVIFLGFNVLDYGDSWYVELPLWFWTDLSINGW